MARLRLPHATAAVLDAATPLEREILFDTDADEVRIGDGTTLGGIKLAKKNASSATVTATGSTTARTLADRAADEFHVLDYGAVPDGTTAAQTSIVAAIAAANSRGGGTVIIGGDSRGNDFKIAATVHALVDSNITIEFVGGARLVAATGLDEPVLDLVGSETEVANPVDVEIHIINPDIDCSAGNSAGAAEQYCTAMNFDYLRQVHVIGGRLYGGEEPDNTNADSGITTVTCGAVIAEGVLIRGFGDAGVYANGNNTVGADGDGGSVVVRDCVIQRCNNAVIGKRELSRLYVGGGSIEECVGGVLSAEITSPSYVGPVRRMEVHGVRFKKVTANMVRFRGPTVGSVRDNTFEDWGYDYDGTGSVGANAYAVSIQGTRDTDFTDNRFILTDWTRDDQRAYNFQNVTLNSVLYTHGNCRFANNSYRGIARITVWTDTGETHDFSDEYLEDISSTYFDNGTEASDTIVRYREYAVSRPQIWKNGSTFNAGQPIVVSPTQITGNQNDYAPTGLSTADILRLDVDAARTITGISATGAAAGRRLTLHNISSFPITLSNASGSSSAANRFSFYADLSLEASGSVELFYDGTSSRWKLVSLANPGCIYEEFTGNGTWTKRAGVVRVDVDATGGGGGGGGGGKTTAGTAVSGGGGGGGAGRQYRRLKPADLSATETVTVGAAGASGAGATVDGAGADGGAGGTSSFGSHVSVKGGGFGSGGNASTASGGGGGGSTRSAGGNASAGTGGTAASFGTAGGSGGNASDKSTSDESGGSGGGGCGNTGTAGRGGLSFGCSGGGSGGGVSAANAFQAGGAALRMDTTGSIAGGATEGAAGTAGATQTSGAGSGASGGAGSDAGTGGAGGAGASPGGGGGGGGGAHTGNGGAGGAGGAGIVRVWNLF